jgi:hypothetical protein
MVDEFIFGLAGIAMLDLVPLQMPSDFSSPWDDCRDGMAIGNPLPITYLKSEIGGDNP